MTIWSTVSISWEINRLHHITAFASDPQENLDFFRNVLGMRLLNGRFDSIFPRRFFISTTGTRSEPPVRLSRSFPSKICPKGRLVKARSVGVD
ncbi:VOC family protein [Halocatena marina]|uniref:VOC family protein n=1 Tax=Halocatena marina TaxID=2934937 RepID=A0ABD5YMV9_9EURY|nr:VOC family protein [Halocatena marina]